MGNLDKYLQKLRNENTALDNQVRLSNVQLNIPFVFS